MTPEQNLSNYKEWMIKLKEHLIEQVKFFKEGEHPEWYPTDQYIIQINMLNICLLSLNYFTNGGTK